MNSSILIIFLIYFSNVGLHFGSALICYTCTKVTDEKCAVGGSSIRTVQCREDETLCAIYDVGPRTMRSCGKDDYCTKTDSTRTCYTCTTDLCNSRDASSGGCVPNYSISLGIFFAVYISLKLII